jgi:hypothetical protein
MIQRVFSEAKESLMTMGMVKSNEREAFDSSLSLSELCLRIMSYLFGVCSIRLSWPSMSASGEALVN